MTFLNEISGQGWPFWSVAVILPVGVVALMFGLVSCLGRWDDLRRRRAQERSKGHD